LLDKVEQVWLRTRPDGIISTIWGSSNYSERLCGGCA
jgi:hypothetical protein